MKYTAINIGPVLKTLSLARRPRELWIASYLFSCLMECIVLEAEKCGKIIAPKKWERNDEDGNLPVGLYPDRIYIKPDKSIKADDILNPAWDMFSDKAGIECRDYFNIMHTSCDKNSEVEALIELNKRLDLLELCVQTPDSESDPQEEIMRKIQEGKNSPIYKLATGEDEFPVDTLAEISSAQLKMVVNEKVWNEFAGEAKNENGNPYSVLQQEAKSFHRYFCVVQADGDNMGKTLTNKALKDGAINKISTSLLEFGKAATKAIQEYEGMPIYAGGDDLLFLAPVRGKGSASIFELLDKLEACFKVVRDKCMECLPEFYKDEKDKDLPSLSFGVSICYYKHPLYEALESARHLLFDVAKEVNGKKAVAWKLEKHSGESFDACFSRRDEALDAAFKTVIEKTVDGKTVTQAIHKSKNNWKLLSLCLMDAKNTDKTDRLDAFFKTVLEETSQNKEYFDAVKDLMVKVFNAQNPTDDKTMKQYSETLYSMLRTAKFINGEDTKDE